MNTEWLKQVEPLTVEAFAPYGRIVDVPTTKPEVTGPGWECWYGFQHVECRWPVYLGAVATKHRPLLVDSMERHTFTFEYLYPHDHALIQPVGLPLQLDDERAQPDPETVRAFLIPVGSGVIMHPGTWHSAAFPVGRDCTYGFLNMEPDFEYTPEWVNLAGNDVVRFGLQQES